LNILHFFIRIVKNFLTVQTRFLTIGWGLLQKYTVPFCKHIISSFKNMEVVFWNFACARYCFRCKKTVLVRINNQSAKLCGCMCTYVVQEKTCVGSFLEPKIWKAFAWKFERNVKYLQEQTKHWRPSICPCGNCRHYSILERKKLFIFAFFGHFCESKSPQKGLTCRFMEVYPIRKGPKIRLQRNPWNFLPVKYTINHYFCNFFKIQSNVICFVR